MISPCPRNAIINIAGFRVGYWSLIRDVPHVVRNGCYDDLAGGLLA